MKKTMVNQMRKNPYLITLFITISLVFLLEIFFNNIAKVNAQKYENFPSSYVGVWEGSGIQNTGREWSIFLALIPGQIDSIVGTIAYPS
ncbi:hypothetical protein [Okeania sp.]|uniref:hypothetical protein n=1 Tax=Okeania sp. TaxID=3100323 RepID=UPI002B4B8674|nr:hypothetical protein [Okeania sp.]MEB3343711.1 hypothetical protein [Okeania sp.]